MSQLTREEKLALLDEIEEKAKRLKQKRSSYKPNSLQLSVHQSQKRIRLVTSANGVGKTTLGVQEAYDTATLGISKFRSEGKKLPVPNKGVIVLDAPEKVERWIEEFNKWFNTEKWKFIKHGKPYITEIVLENGSAWVFKFHLQEELSFESEEYEYAIYDEPPPRKAYVGISRGLRRSDHSWSLIVGTPLAQPWMKRDLYDPAVRGERTDIEVFKAGILVNKDNLGAGYIENFSKDLNEHERRVRLHGDFAHLEGLALADLWSREIHMVPSAPWPRHAPVVVACDPHPAKAHHAIMLGVNRYEQFYVIKSIKSKASATEFGKILKEFVTGFNVVDQVCDSLGAAPTSGGDGRRSFIDVINEQGLRFRSTTFKEKSEDMWVQDIRDLLTVKTNNFGQKLPGIFIYDCNLELVNEFESVMWRRNRHDEITKGVLDIANKDFLSCLKYALAASPRYNAHREIHRRKAATSYGMRRKP